MQNDNTNQKPEICALLKEALECVQDLLGTIDRKAYTTHEVQEVIRRADALLASAANPETACEQAIRIR